MTVPRCLVLAHGRGLRLESETGGASKGLLRLDGRTTILSNLLDACASQGLDPLVTVRPDDQLLTAFVADRRFAYREPNGYIVDLARLSEGVDDVIALDCDTVAAPAALRTALHALLTTACDLTLVLAATPLSDDPRSIRPVVRRGRLVGLSDNPRLPRTTGLYRFRGRALRSLRGFVDRGEGTFHDFMEYYTARHRRVAVHVMGTAFNVNWPADLESARTWWERAQLVADR